MLISQYEAAERLGISRQAANKWKNQKPVPAFLVRMSNGKYQIDDQHPEWIARVQNPGQAMRNRKNARQSEKKLRKKAAREQARENIAAITGIKNENENENGSESEKDNINYIRQIDGGRYFKGALRQAILNRDKNRCVLCGKAAADGVSLEVDHILEYEDGGKTTFDNGQTLCTECNKGKHSLKNKNKNQEIISQWEFAKRVGAHRNAVSRAIDSEWIDIDPQTGKINYTTEVVKWFKHEKEKTNISNPPMIPRPEPANPEDADLIRRATLAELHNQIYTSKIKEEKAKQEEIKTLEIKKDLAPIGLVRHFFSFAESLIQRIYRKPNEIEPQLAALFLAKENKKATMMLVRELESLIVDAQKDLIMAIKEEGFKVKGAKVAVGEKVGENGEGKK
ncbi:MAG TPA: HNH endonuclease signature motif containing protein [Spirochaetota bacterium]|nr:HNH endonuclease signature motif containing protein [Spirochaetota bacterium]